MRDFKLLCVLALTCILMVAAPCFIQASTIGPITTSTPIPSTLTDWAGSLTFPQFNPANGTLQSVEVELSSGLTTILTVQNSGGSASSGSAKTELQVTVQDAGLNLNAPELDMLSPAFGYVLSAGSSTTSGLLSKNANDGGNIYTQPAVLSEFTGLGTISLPASTFTQTLLANTGGNTSSSQVTDAFLTGTVTYNYSPAPTPEPSTLALLAVGAVGLFGCAWRKRKLAA